MSQQYAYDEEGEEAAMPFESVDKATTLQQCRVFGEVPLDVNKCIYTLTEVLYLLYTGTTLTPDETTTLFFQSTKLMQSTQPKLRRLHHILLKELSPLVEQSFIASNSLMGDAKSDREATKASAVRTLFAVMDKSMYSAMDRTIAESLTSRNGNVVVAALVTGIRMAQVNADMPRKWLQALTQLLQERGKAQYAAMALLHHTRRNDRLSMSRLMEQVGSYRIASPLAHCLIVRIGAELMREDLASSQAIYAFMVRQLDSHDSEMVVFEAAKAVCSLRGVAADIVAPAARALARYLTWTSPVVRFAAMHLLNQLAATHPSVVEPYNAEIEALLGGSGVGGVSGSGGGGGASDRLLETLAITTLLKTGSEATMERLMTQLSSDAFLSDLSDAFKLLLVHTLWTLSSRHAGQYNALLSFLYRLLSVEGSCELKQAVVYAMMDVARTSAEAKAAVLTHLAEFIDDCEFASIMKCVLTYMGDEVPADGSARKYVRYVYNHATLEQAEIRAVAVSTLAKLAARIPRMRRAILQLLRRCCRDSEDEVRERAMLYVKVLTLHDEAMVQQLIGDVAEAVASQRRVLRQREQARQQSRSGAAADATAAAAAATSTTRSDNNDDDDDDNATAGDIGGDDGTRASTGVGAAYASATAHHDKGAAAATTTTTATRSHDVTAARAREAMQRVKPLRDLGEVVHSSAAPQLLTDADGEYVVSVMKHVCASSHVVLQFIVHNALDEVVFRNVTVVTDTSELIDGGGGGDDDDDNDNNGRRTEALFAVPAEVVPPRATRYAYVVLRFAPHAFPLGVVASTFRFAMRDAARGSAHRGDAVAGQQPSYSHDKSEENNNDNDNDDNDNDDEAATEEYVLEEFALEMRDFVTPAPLGGVAAYERRWAALAGDESSGTYALSSMRNVTTAVHELVQFFGMHVEGGVPATVQQSSHTLLLSGRVADAAQTLVLVHARVFVTTDQSIALQMTLRGGDAALREHMANALLA